jgi:hypothetical protein
MGRESSSLFQPWIGLVFYTIVALVWLVPDRRIERMAQNHQLPG